jgi:hypothetical protein
MYASGRIVHAQYKYGSKDVRVQNLDKESHWTTGAPCSTGHLLDCVSNPQSAFQAQQHPAQVKKSMVTTVLKWVRS